MLEEVEEDHLMLLHQEDQEVVEQEIIQEHQLLQEQLIQVEEVEEVQDLV
jgi:hypothetical protein